MPFIPLEVFANNASTTVTSGGTTAPVAGTAESWTVAASASFPVVELGAQVFHVADPAAPSEMVTVNVTAGTTWQVTRGAEGTTPVAHAGGFQIVQVVTAGTLAALQYPPWQFPVQRYGAQGDGKIGTGGTGTAGQATFTDAGAAFVNAAAPAGDVGKVIIINQGVNSATPPDPFCGTIIAVSSATSVTLNANLAANCTSCPYIYGTDDTAPVNAAITAAAAWATATGNYKAQIMFEPCNYMIGGAPFQSTSPLVYNTQIPLPAGQATGRKLCLDLIGPGDASELNYFESLSPNLQGTCLVSTAWVTAADGTYGQQSVIGGPSAGTGLQGGFANTLVNISGITVVCPWNSGQIGFNFRYVAQANIPSASYLAFVPVNYQVAGGVGGVQFWYGSGTSFNVPTSNLSVGMWMPTNGNNDNANIGAFSCEGASYGLAYSEHVNVTRIFCAYCANGLYAAGGGSPEHGVTFVYASIEECTNALLSGGSGPFTHNIMALDCEVITGYHVSDFNNNLSGTICVIAEGQAVAVQGAANVTILDAQSNRTVPAAPSYSLGVAFRNPWWRPVWVQLSGGTTTGISVGPTSAAATTVGTTTPAAFRLPSGWWCSIAGSVKPSTFTVIPD